MTWYVVQTKPSDEFRAAFNLNAQDGYSAFLPLYWKWARNRKRSVNYRERVKKPLFPGYLFIEVEDHANWLPITNTRGVNRILTTCDGSPAPIKDELVHEILAQCRKDGTIRMDDVIPLPLFREGQTVRITAGPFTGYEGRVQRTDKGRVQLLLDFIHRTMPLSLPEHTLAVV